MKEVKTPVWRQCSRGTAPAKQVHAMSSNTQYQYINSTAWTQCFITHTLKKAYHTVTKPEVSSLALSLNFVNQSKLFYCSKSPFSWPHNNGPDWWSPPVASWSSKTMVILTLHLSLQICSPVSHLAPSKHFQKLVHGNPQASHKLCLLASNHFKEKIHPAYLVWHHHKLLASRD